MKKILLATDGSESAGYAIDLLCRLPLSRKTKIEVVHVVEETPSFLREGDIDPDDREALRAITREIELEAEDIVGRAVGRLKKAGWTVHAHTRKGEPAEEILATAEISGVDHIALGARGHEDDDRPLGRTASRVLKHANIAVLVARKPENAEGDLHVLVPHDGSLASGAAVAIVRRLVSEATHVTLLYVPTVATTFYRRDIIERMSASWQAHKAQVTEELERVAHQLRTSGTIVEIRVLDGGTDAADEVVEAARLLRPDLTVVGRSGKGALQRFVLGSVSETLAELAPGSVWVAGEVPEV